MGLRHVSDICTPMSIIIIFNPYIWPVLAPSIIYRYVSSYICIFSNCRYNRSVIILQYNIAIQRHQGEHNNTRFNPTFEYCLVLRTYIISRPLHQWLLITTGCGWLWTGILPTVRNNDYYTLQQRWTAVRCTCTGVWVPEYTSTTALALGTSC